ncbi:GntR family transcriptional regulator [Periweissella cryptocerci]|uniref:GntR family transcriptional regulator n=1 Tax=Periweissella cryptocerci TaxID=2506420 RepID=A0A4V1AIW0_9LACO|nr:GntR family transcriptional regulator [Periweissella cryptocerci]QBO36875.1 GntR family transcriptional regulator [Periweissella cryptocerci]
MKVVSKPVQVYNSILDKIDSEHFVGMLPSENDLTKLFNVSRGTIRSSLNLLKEDGIISSIKGKGNIINAHVTSEKKSGLEINDSPFYKSCDKVIENVDAYSLRHAESSHSKKLFGAGDHFTINLWYGPADQYIGNDFCMVSKELAEAHNVESMNSEALRNFLEKQLYDLSSYSTLSMTISLRDKSDFKRKFADEVNQLVVLTEDLFDSDHALLCQSKYYVPLQFFRTMLNRTNY